MGRLDISHTLFSSHLLPVHLAWKLISTRQEPASLLNDFTKLPGRVSSSFSNTHKALTLYTTDYLLFPRILYTIMNLHFYQAVSFLTPQFLNLCTCQRGIINLCVINALKGTKHRNYQLHYLIQKRNLAKLLFYSSTKKKKTCMPEKEGVLQFSSQLQDNNMVHQRYRARGSQWLQELIWPPAALWVMIVSLQYILYLCCHVKSLDGNY